MSDEHGAKWMLLKVPGVGDVVGWVDDSIFCERGIVEIENVTRLVPTQTELRFVKMAERLPFNIMAIPTWMPAPSEFAAEASKLWDRIIVPERRILPHD